MREFTTWTIMWLGIIYWLLPWTAIGVCFSGLKLCVEIFEEAWGIRPREKERVQAATGYRHWPFDI